MPAPKRQLKRVSQVVESSLNPWPELARITLEDASGQDWILFKAVIKRVHTDFNPDPDGKHDGAFIAIGPDEATEPAFCLLVSQDVLVSAISELIEKNAFPIIGQFDPPDRAEGRRYWRLT